MNLSQKLKQNKTLFNRWSAFYDCFPLGWWLHGIQRMVITRLQLSPNDHVLDVGCGTGTALKMLLEHGHQGRLAGVDLSSKMLEKARRKLGKNAELRLADAAKLPFKEGAFDMVMTTEAFHHFPEPKKAIREMKRVLGNGGRLVIADINFYLRPFHWLFEKIEPGCVHVYTSDEIRDLFVHAGLKNIKQQRIGLLVIMTEGVK